MLLSSDPAKLPEYIGVRVKKEFVGYGVFEGYVSKIDKKSKQGMPIYISWDDGDKGWMDFDEFSGIALRDGDGNLLFRENKRKISATPESGDRPSKRTLRGSSTSEGSEEQDVTKAASLPGSAAPLPAAVTPAVPTPSNPAVPPAGQNGAQLMSQTESDRDTLTAGVRLKQESQGEQGPSTHEKEQPGTSNMQTQHTQQNGVGQVAGPHQPTTAAPHTETNPTPPQHQHSSQIPQPRAEPLHTAAPAVASLPRPPPDVSTALKSTAQVVVHGGLVYISGQHVPDTMAKEGYRQQTQRVLTQLDQLLKSVGVDKHRLLQVRVYLRSMADGAEEFNKAWLDWVDQEALPARTLVEAKLVREGLLVEIEAVAALDSVPS